MSLLTDELRLIIALEIDSKVKAGLTRAYHLVLEYELEESKKNVERKKNELKALGK